MITFAFAGLFSAIVCLLFPAFLAYTFFWFETVRDGRSGRFRELSNGRAWRWLARGILSSGMSLVLSILFFPLRFRRRLWHPEPYPSCSNPPVIFVHGLYHNASAWFLYRRWFKQAGFLNAYAMEYAGWNGSFHDILRDLDEFVTEVASRFPGKKVILIGHSLGGLLCRACLDQPGCSGKIAAVVTLGAPHQGTRLASLGIGKLARSLSYRGELILEIERQAGQSAIPCLALYSPLDAMVLPEGALRASCPSWEHRESYPVSHVGMIYHRPTAMQVLKYLRGIGLSL